MSVCNCGRAFLLGGHVRVVIKEKIGGHAAWCHLAPSQTTVTCLYSDQMHSYLGGQTPAPSCEKKKPKQAVQGSEIRLLKTDARSLIVCSTQKL